MRDDMRSKRSICLEKSEHPHELTTDRHGTRESSPQTRDALRLDDSARTVNGTLERAISNRSLKLELQFHCRAGELDLMGGKEATGRVPLTSSRGVAMNALLFDAWCKP